jgi:hypothetical protein
MFILIENAIHIMKSIWSNWDIQERPNNILEWNPLSTERLKLNPGAYIVQIKTQHFGVMNLLPIFFSIQNELNSTFV